MYSDLSKMNKSMYCNRPIKVLTELTQNELIVLSCSLYTTLHSEVAGGRPCDLSCDLSNEASSSSSVKLPRLRDGDCPFCEHK